MLSDVLRTALGIEKNETVLIITDDNKLEIAGKIQDAVRELSHEVMVIKMKPRDHHAQEPPEAITAAMQKVDVVIAPTTMSLTHTEARKKACEKGARIATMPGITMEMLEKGGMTADYRQVRVTSDRITELLNRGKTVRIETDSGCDFQADINGRKAKSDSGIFKKGDGGNLPAGESFIAPMEGKSRGKLVFDASFGGVGVLEDPIIIHIEDGRAKKVEGDNGRLGEFFKKYINGDNVAEIGIGTNPNAKVIGNVLEDEKVLGTVHVAFGDNHTFGGDTRAEIHLDGIIREPTLYIDNKKIMDHGNLLI